MSTRAIQPADEQAPPAPIELPAGNGEWLDIARALSGNMAEQASRICALLDTARSAAKIAGGELTGMLDRMGDNYCALDTLRRMVAGATICTPAAIPTTAARHAPATHEQEACNAHFFNKQQTTDKQ